MWRWLNGVGVWRGAVRCGVVRYGVVWCGSGEHTLFCLRESGGTPAFRLQKRLEYHPAAIAMYSRPTPADGTLSAPMAAR